MGERSDDGTSQVPNFDVLVEHCRLLAKALVHQAVNLMRVSLQEVKLCLGCFGQGIAQKVQFHGKKHICNDQEDYPQMKLGKLMAG